jgi:preprotein translocase subunit SecA
VGLHGYAQQDPLVVFKQEAFQAFEDLKASMQSQMVRNFFRVQVQMQAPAPAPSGPMSPPAPASGAAPNGGGPITGGASVAVSAQTSGRRETVAAGAAAGVQVRGAPPAPPRPVIAGQAGGRPATGGGRSPKVGRNDPCPCGSGLKYKKCHGR